MPTNDAPSLALLFLHLLVGRNPGFRNEVSSEGGGAKGLSVELAIKQNGRANKVIVLKTRVKKTNILYFFQLACALIINGICSIINRFANL